MHVGAIIKEWWALLCTQRPNYARIDLISKKLLSSIYHLSIPPTLELIAASLQLVLKNVKSGTVIVWDQEL